MCVCLCGGHEDLSAELHYMKSSARTYYSKCKDPLAVSIYFSVLWYGPCQSYSFLLMFHENVTSLPFEPFNTCRLDTKSRALGSVDQMYLRNSTALQFARKYNRPYTTTTQKHAAGKKTDKSIPITQVIYRTIIFAIVR